MPIFTEDLFEAFLRITGGVSLIDKATFNKAIEDRQAVEPTVQELLAEIK
jgi:hypothetical protein